LKQRRAWFDSQLDLDPDRLVFINETWTAANMNRSHGRCARGERLRMGLPHGHRKTTTLVAGLRMTGVVAPMVLDGPINGEGTVRNFVWERAVEHYAVMALMKRSPKMTANWALAIVHSRGGIFHCFSDRCKIR